MFLIFATVLSLLRFTGSFEVTVPQRRVLAVLGQPVVLGCSYTPDPKEGLDSLVVTWQRSEDQQVVHSFYYGRSQLDKQSPNYAGRTELYPALLQAGNASLRLQRVGPADTGRYLCTVSSLQGSGKGEVQLEYAAPYAEPRLNIQVKCSGISLQFESEGYPAPQVQWTGTPGTNLSTQEEVSGPGEDGLFLLRTSVTVEDPGPGVNLSFVLKNSALGQELLRPISFSLAPGGLGNSIDGTRLTIVLLISALCLLVCLGLAAFAYIRRQRT
ncbi:CD276 antigen-like [Conger conger]|uniref:CD276 antigen-like n=1 Tax=Conger conger TaxID=82655 RepID=UPI002A5AF51F|nr:CD276 antigen-like [Conger conger]